MKVISNAYTCSCKRALDNFKKSQKFDHRYRNSGFWNKKVRQNIADLHKSMISLFLSFEKQIQLCLHILHIHFQRSPADGAKHQKLFVSIENVSHGLDFFLIWMKALYTLAFSLPKFLLCCALQTR